VRLAQEAFAGRSIAMGGGLEELERNGPAEPVILGAVDDAHAAAAELLEDSVMGDRLADHGEILA
jgi:hypothetical protein